MKSSNSPSVPDDLVQIGKVIGAHGISGAVRIYSYAESDACFAVENDLVLIDAQGGTERRKIVWSQPHKRVMRLLLDGITTRDQAEALAGREVYITRADLPPLSADTYYWRDLIGLPVYTETDEYLGVVEQIIPTGANDVYVVKTPSGTAVPEILLPAIASVILEIDLDGRRMRVRLLEGLI